MRARAGARSRLAIPILAAAALGALGAPAQDRGGVSPVEVVRAFVQEYNRLSVDGMLRLAADDIEWLSIDADGLHVETHGSDELRSFMVAYFRRVPTAHSDLLVIEGLGPYVTTHERATGARPPGTPAAASIAVYEVREGLIRRVWYFPAVEGQ